MSSDTGRALRVRLFGESHGELVGAVLDGLPAGLPLDLAQIQAFLDRRSAARAGELGAARREADRPRLVSGLCEGHTTGSPLCALFDNRDARPGEYAFLPFLPRPGHADWPAWARSGGWDALSGGGHHSGRLTLPHAFAGAVALQLLALRGVAVYGRLAQVGAARDVPVDPLRPDEAALEALRRERVPALSPEARAAMRAAVEAARQAEDSVGGLVECLALRVPAGLGDPYFDNLESAIAAQLFAIPGVKGVEFGDGMAVCALRGSAYNDPYAPDGEGRPAPVSNRAGGLLGGLSTGAPLVVRCAFRPTASIARAQQTVDLRTGRPETLRVSGRHDPCIALRAVPVVEAAVALALADAVLARYGNAPLSQRPPEARA